MSSYYHEYVPGFNFWYIVAPVLVLIAVVVGLCRFEFDERTLKITKIYNDRFVKLLATVATVIFGVLLFSESWAGIIQFGWNGLSRGESPRYAELIAGGGVVVLLVLYWALVFYACEFASKKREKHLNRKIAKKLAERRRTTRRMTIVKDVSSERIGRETVRQRQTRFERIIAEAQLSESR